MKRKTNYVSCGLLLLAFAFPMGCKGGKAAPVQANATEATEVAASPAKADPNAVDCSKPEPAVPRCPPKLSEACAKQWAPALAWRAKCKKK